MKFPKGIKEAAKFYIDQGFRPMPIYGVNEGCQHRKTKDSKDCEGQCFGKVPSEANWPDVPFFSPEQFKETGNLALIMGSQLDGRWFVGFDIDGKLDLTEFFDLPETLECTSRRGRHLIFEVHQDAPLGNWNDVLGLRSKTLGYKRNYEGALDIKYARGAMVSPPSEAKDGIHYTWKSWRQPAFLPESEVLFLIRKRKYYVPNVKRYKRWSLVPSHKGKVP